MYCSLEDIKKSLPETVLLDLTDDDNEGQFVVVPPNAAYSRVVDAIKRADTLIDGYVSGRYALPFTTVPDLIRSISVNLAICEIYDRKHEAVLPDAIISRRKANIKTLEKLQTGEIVLPGQEKEAPVEFLVDKTEDDREFTDDLLSRF